MIFKVEVTIETWTSSRMKYTRRKTGGSSKNKIVVQNINMWKKKKTPPTG